MMYMFTEARGFRSVGFRIGFRNKSVDFVVKTHGSCYGSLPPPLIIPTPLRCAAALVLRRLLRRATGVDFDHGDVVIFTAN